MPHMCAGACVHASYTCMHVCVRGRTPISMPKRHHHRWHLGTPAPPLPQIPPATPPPTTHAHTSACARMHTRTHTNTHTPHRLVHGDGGVSPPPIHPLPSAPAPARPHTPYRVVNCPPPPPPTHTRAPRSPTSTPTPTHRLVHGDDGVRHAPHRHGHRVRGVPKADAHGDAGCLDAPVVAQATCNVTWRHEKQCQPRVHVRVPRMHKHGESLACVRARNVLCTHCGQAGRCAACALPLRWSRLMAATWGHRVVVVVVPAILCGACSRSRCRAQAAGGTPWQLGSSVLWPAKGRRDASGWM